MSRGLCSLGVGTEVASPASSPTPATVRPAASQCRTLRAASSGAASATLPSKTTCACSHIACTRYASLASLAPRESVHSVEQLSPQSITASQSHFKTLSHLSSNSNNCYRHRYRSNTSLRLLKQLPSSPPLPHHHHHHLHLRRPRRRPLQQQCSLHISCKFHQQMHHRTHRILVTCRCRQGVEWDLLVVEADQRKMPWELG